MSYELQFPALGSDQNNWPPDTQLAVGSTSLVEVVNSNFSIWTRSGAFVISVDLNAFFSVLPGYTFVDPRVVYDSLSGRFILTGQSFDAANNSQVYLAVSVSSDPAGLWNTYLVSRNSSGTAYDQPKVGVSSDKIVIAWADYSGITFVGEELWIVDKAEAIAGLPGPPPEYVQYTADLYRFGMVPSLETTANGVEYVVYNNADLYLNQNEDVPTAGIIAISGTPSQKNVTSNYYVGSLPQIKSTSFPPDAPQPGGGPLIATNDDRFLSAIWQNGILWTGGNDWCKPPGDTQWHSCLRLVQIGTGGSSPAVLQNFDVGVAGTDLYYPAETMDGIGNLFVAFSSSSATQYASVGAVAQSISAPLGTTGSVLMTQSGLGIANNCGIQCQNPDGSSLNRWGDYSAAVPDPTNPIAVWIAGEYAGSATDQLDWATGLAQLALPLTPIPAWTATPGSTATAMSTATPGSTAVPTMAATGTPTATGTAASTIPQSPTASPVATVSVMPSETPTITATPATTITPTTTYTATNNATTPWTPTATVSPMATTSATPSPPTGTDTPTATSTPVVVQVTPGVASQVSIIVGLNQVSVNVPSGNNIAQLVVSAPPTPVSIKPDEPTFQSLPGAVIIVSASDANGNPVGELSAPITITIRFVPPPGVNAQVALIYTLNPVEDTAQALPTKVLANDDGSITATATTSHLSPFEVFAPGALTPVPQLYVPVVASRASDD